MNQYKYGSKLYLFLVSVLAFVNTAITAYSVYLISKITDAALVSNFDQTVVLVKSLIIVAFASFIAKLLLTFYEVKYLDKSMSNLRYYYIKRLFSLNVSNFDFINEEVYLSNLTNDMSRIRDKRYMMIVQFTYMAFSIITSLILLYSVSESLLAFGIIMFLFSMYTSKKTSAPLKEQEEIKSYSLSKYTNYIQESLLGFFIIKQNQLEANQIEKFTAHAKRLAFDNFILDRKETHITALNNFVQTTIMLVIIIVGLIVSKVSGTSAGSIILVGSAFMNSMYPMQQIVPLIISINGTSALFTQFDELLYFENDPATIEVDSIENIYFDNTSLGYGDSVVLKNVDIKVNAFEKVLIVGESGSGKSTLLKSIQRQLSPIENDIYVNGERISNITSKSYYKRFSIIDQVGFIFNASLKDNITLYQNSDEKIVSEILSVVDLNNINLDYELENNGSNISGGQRARVLLARALYLNSEVIIGDELFATLSRDVGSTIEKLMLNLDKTIINVSHIIYEENFDLYDKVFLVKDQKVVKLSTFDELKDNNIIMF